MSKPLIGLIVGAVLGVPDGLSALLSAPNDPEVRNGMVGIVIGSTMKGMIAGGLIGLFARRVPSVPASIAFGLAIGAALAAIVAVLGGKYYLEIILPGSLVGAIVGCVTARYGGRPAPAIQS